MRVIGILIMLSRTVAASPVYSVINLGGLGGSSSTAYRINNDGAVVGWAQTATGNEQSFLSNNGGALENLLPSATDDAYATGINNSGVIVGTTYQNGQVHGWIKNGSSVDSLEIGIWAAGINDNGVVVGGNGHAFRLVNGSYQDLGVLPGGDWSAAYGINKVGTVVGNGSKAWGGFRGFVWSPRDGMLELGTLGGANSYTTDINDQGQVVGHSSVASGFEHAFLSTGVSLTDLGTLHGGNSYAYGINNSGSIVGYSWSDKDENPSAFVYVDGAMLELTSLLGRNSGWEFLVAYGINDDGEIVGIGLLDGKPTAFLLEPVRDGVTARQ
jgi:probable HAF family extracellular repeat protein